MGNLMIAQVEQERLKQCVEKQQQVQLFFLLGEIMFFFFDLAIWISKRRWCFFWPCFAKHSLCFCHE